MKLAWVSLANSIARRNSIKVPKFGAGVDALGSWIAVQRLAGLHQYSTVYLCASRQALNAFLKLFICAP